MKLEKDTIPHALWAQKRGSVQNIWVIVMAVLIQYPVLLYTSMLAIENQSERCIPDVKQPKFKILLRFLTSRHRFAHAF